MKNVREVRVKPAALLSLLVAVGVGCQRSASTSGSSAGTAIAGITSQVQQVNHVVVIYLENHSFDNLYGEFPGANGLTAPLATHTQTDSNGKTYKYLPQPINTGASPPAPDPRFPWNLKNGPFCIDDYVTPDQEIPDLVHRFYQEQMQIHSGMMDRFAAVSDAAGLSMGYYHTADLPLAQEAANYILCDNFFHAAFGGSFLNHQWLIAAASPRFPNAPPSIVAQADPNNNMTKDGQVDPYGYVINTSYTVNTPHPANVTTATLVPNQTHATIGDRLNDANVSWAWYSGGWNDAVAGNPDKLFQFHHQPFAYFANYADGTPGRAAHLLDEDDFVTAAQSGTLPSVSFVKPLGNENEHPGYANISSGENHAESLINAVRNGPNWQDCLIIVTYDEHGGFYDHVQPPIFDYFGPGLRVPAIIISPFVQQGIVDHTLYDTTSILAFIELRWGLPSLTGRDANANPLSGVFPH
ncbi:MAG TPA: alkaline phosphatase family protein [Planctomycetota bacterium]|nr:alkaline phosphatase family protein [Planctomycetota bacterium]